MANHILKNTYYLIILSLCIDEGDGRWRQKNMGNLRHDLQLYKTISEKIEREIEAFYDEYQEHRPEGDTIDTAHYKHVTNTFNRYSDVNIVDKPLGGKGKKNFTYNVENKTKNTELIQMKESSNKTNSGLNLDVTKQNSTWPKFEDMLLEIGKKYDWKNDRWIKVKEKLKPSVHSIDKIKLNNDDKIKLHELHKFNYKLVKLNRSKNRRSVIVAVTAVR